MKPNWKKVFGITKDIVEVLVPQVQAVEDLVKTIPQIKAMKGQEKQDALIALARHVVETAETFSGKDLVNDPEVEAAMRDVGDAIVHLQNVLVKKTAAAA